MNKEGKHHKRFCACGIILINIALFVSVTAASFLMVVGEL